MTNSATLRVLENGALNTGTPSVSAVRRSTWFVPMQKAPTAMSFGAAASTSAVSCVRDRMPTTCASAMASLSACPSSARACCWMFV